MQVKIKMCCPDQCGSVGHPSAKRGVCMHGLWVCPSWDGGIYRKQLIDVSLTLMFLSLYFYLSLKVNK